MPICFVTHGERGVKYNDIQLVIDIVHLLSRYENLLSRDAMEKYIAIVGSMTTCFLRSVGNYVLEPLSIANKCNSKGVEKNCIKNRES